MKKIILILSMSMFVMLVQAQTMTEEKVSIDKESRPAFAMKVDFSKKIAEEALENRFKNDKLKGKSYGSFKKYEKVKCADLCVNEENIYTNVDGNAKSATVYIVIQNANGSFVSSSEGNVACIEKYMSSLYEDIVALDLKYRIEEQTKVYEKAEKEYSRLVDKKEELTKELEKTEGEIKAADQNRANQKAALEHLKKQEK